MISIVSLTLILCIITSVYSRLSKRIVEGTNAADGEFPFLVSFRNLSGCHSCGGTIISPKYILTAAHCCAGIKCVDSTIQYGQTKIQWDSKNVIKIIKVISHKEFSGRTNQNDIALLELAENLIFSQYVNKINLPKLNEEFADGLKVTVMGWGANSNNDWSPQHHLQKVQVCIVNNLECDKQLPKGSYRVTSTNICAAVPGTWKGPFNGDSGGPLIYNDKIIGIVSWGALPYTPPAVPSVYTKVASYITWIRENAGLK